MLTGTVEGRFLEFLVYATQAKRVLEFGTYSGYSSISMAAALPSGGHIDTCEIEEKHAAVAQRYIDEAGYSDRITIHLGPAVETVERLEGEFDFVFIDADKPNYVNYYEAVLPRLSERGLIAADNTLWSGRVLDESDDIRRDDRDPRLQRACARRRPRRERHAHRPRRRHADPASLTV